MAKKKYQSNSNGINRTANDSLLRLNQPLIISSINSFYVLIDSFMQ